MGSSLVLWKAIAQLAATQWGHVARSQLRALEVPDATIDGWDAAGKLVTVHRGVYALRYRRVEPVARACAAVLACGPTAVLSHEAAAALWGMRRWPDPMEVTVTTDRRPSTVRVHRTRTLTSGDVTTQLAIRVTTAARTLRDIRHRIPTDRQFRRLVNQTRVDKLISADDHAAFLGRIHNATRSGGEDTFQDFAIARDLPEVLLNVRVCGFEVDGLFPGYGVIVEIDHPGTHVDPELDAERDTVLQAAAYQVVRLSEHRLLSAPDVEAHRLRAILARRGSA